MSRNVVYGAFVKGRLVYVGKTQQGLGKRMRQHELRKSGPFKLHPGATFMVLAEPPDAEALHEVEQRAIRALAPECNGRVEAPSWLSRAWRRVVAWLATVRRWVRLSLEVVGAVALMWWWLG